MHRYKIGSHKRSYTFPIEKQNIFSIVGCEETMSLIQYPDNATVKSPMTWTSAAAEFKSVGGDKKITNFMFSNYSRNKFTTCTRIFCFSPELRQPSHSEIIISWKHILAFTIPNEPDKQFPKEFMCYCISLGYVLKVWSPLLPFERVYATLPVPLREHWRTLCEENNKWYHLLCRNSYYFTHWNSEKRVFVKVLLNNHWFSLTRLYLLSRCYSK